MNTTGKKIKMTSQLDLAIDDVLVGISTLETPDLEQFLQKIGRLVARRKSAAASDRETVLLQAINQATPSTLQQRYDTLSQKMNAETITPVEHQELLKLIDKLEMQQAKRLKNLIELAHLRNLSLDELMQNLNLLPHV